MSIRNLEHMFHPASVAVIGASARPGSVGATVLRNVLEGGFAGPVYAVNPKYPQLGTLPCYGRVADLPQAPALAVICTPPASVAALVAELGAAGCRAAVVLSAGIADMAAVLAAARPWLLRILGPNCIGLQLPALGLNASFAHLAARPGRLALVSQSGGLLAGMLDWAHGRGIGFSHVISLGDGADVDVGDLLDWLAADPRCDAILLYVEGVAAARKLMSAARSAARAKPLLVLKAGRVAEGARAAHTHCGVLAGADAVFDAALRRAGALRVETTAALFDAAATLARRKPLGGARLAIVSNGGGPAVIATDALVGGGGALAQLAPETLARLERQLPANWSRANPVDLIGDAPPARYQQALAALLPDGGADAVLVMYAPTALAGADAVAAAVLAAAEGSARNLLCCWFGGEAMAPARRRLAAAGLPVYDSPESAVDGFLQLLRYRQAQQLLMEVPAASPAEFVPQRAQARALIEEALACGRRALSEPEAKELLGCYGIPVVPAAIADRVEAAVLLAERIGYPVALKILSPDISHKSEVGGVVLDLASAQAVRDAAQAMRERLHALHPQAHLRGFTVQAMARRPAALELIAGAVTDPVFGPVVVFGQGGVAVEAIADRAVALPPLNSVLARDLIGRTQVARLMRGYRNCPPVDHDAVCAVLIRIASLLADLPEVVELDINPLLADHAGCTALDARMAIAPAAAGSARFAIRPYPVELEEEVDWRGQALTLRPIRPEDAPQHLALFQALAPQDVRFRLFGGAHALSAAQLARFTQIDYEREMAFIAARGTGAARETLAVVRAVADPDNLGAEFAIVVRSDLHGQGLGTLLMNKLLRYCRQRGTGELFGEALADNRRMLQLARRLGFSIEAGGDGGASRMRLALA